MLAVFVEPLTASGEEVAPESGIMRKESEAKRLVECVEEIDAGAHRVTAGTRTRRRSWRGSGGRSEDQTDVVAILREDITPIQQKARRLLSRCLAALS